MFSLRQDSIHDWPHEWHANPLPGVEGGIFRSNNRGLTWNRITPDNEEFKIQFLSVAYDSTADILYAGTQLKGIARKTGSNDWEWINNGLGTGYLIVPEIKVDPENGDVYILLTGDRPDFTNQSKTGIYKMSRNGTSWNHLRGANRPS